jgi:hypothetical protein
MLRACLILDDRIVGLGRGSVSGYGNTLVTV